MVTKSEKGSKWTESALRILQKRYLVKDAGGRVIEDPDELLDRVATTVAAAESSSGARKRWRRAFLEIMRAQRFLPNSPTLMNAGRPLGQLSACFVLPIEDSLGSIFDTLKASALIHQSGGGTGFSFSCLRPAGGRVRSTHGVASGPVSFMRIFDVATETIKQGGARRGANMAILGINHADIREFISAKRDMQSLTNFNTSVGMTNQFMNSHPEQAELFNEIVTSAWACGEPGLVFLDRVNLFNPTPKAGLIESTNPCGEQPLLPFESCNLGSLNLSCYWSESGMDWSGLKNDVHTAVRFLDNVIEVNHFPLQETRAITIRNRKIGLGVMGFADFLLLSQIRYDSPEAEDWGARLMGFIDREAKRASIKLAAERGSFPAWRGSLWDRLAYPKMRNATVTTVAPTGTISILASCSNGIEPIFAAALARNILGGERLEEIHPAVERVMSSRKKGIEKMDYSDETLRQVLGLSWNPAHEVTVEGHLRIQAVFQRHSDSGVSKTINLPRGATKQDVAFAYIEAFRRGCKGITVFREGSRPTQVLERSVSSCETC